MNYAKSMSKLDEIIQKLSNEKLGMEESLKLYADGIKVAKDALVSLNEFKGQIEILNKDLSQFDIDTEELPTEESFDEKIDDEDGEDADEEI